MSEAHIELKARPAWYEFSDNLDKRNVRATYRLESGEDRKRQSSKLNGAANKIADKEHEHAQLQCDISHCSSQTPELCA